MVPSVKVGKESLVACMKCPLCDQILREATAISICLHTFCRKCIYEKLSDKDVNSCPVCSIYLGSVPMEKLRPDHTLQNIRALIFPYKRERETERTLSSLAVPKLVVVPKRPRTKPASRKTNIHRVAFSSNTEDKLQYTSLQEQVRNKGVGEDAQMWKWNVHLRKPLNCLVEAANRTKPSNLCNQDSPVKFEPLDVPNSCNMRLCKIKIKEQLQISKSQQDNKINHEASPVQGCKRLHDRNIASGKENRPNCQFGSL